MHPKTVSQGGESSLCIQYKAPPPKCIVWSVQKWRSKEYKIGKQFSCTPHISIWWTVSLSISSLSAYVQKSPAPMFAQPVATASSQPPLASLTPAHSSVSKRASPALSTTNVSPVVVPPPSNTQTSVPSNHPPIATEASVRPRSVYQNVLPAVNRSSKVRLTHQEKAKMIDFMGNAHCHNMSMWIGMEILCMKEKEGEKERKRGRGRERLRKSRERGESRPDAFLLLPLVPLLSALEESRLILEP